jgi:hypothetical protein
MASYVGLGVFGLGILLLVVAFDASGFADSIAFRLANISQHQSAWLLAGGGISVAIGLALVFTRSPKP